MKAKKNTLPVAPFNLRQAGPMSQAELTKKVGFFRYAHGVGADRRATIDPTPCPKCKGAVEWALTYKREGEKVVPYIYARCRRSPKSHRWAFAQAEVKPAIPQTEQETKRLLKASMQKAARKYTPPTPPTPQVPAPRPSVGTELMASWIDKRIDVLAAELERLTKIRALAGEVQQLEKGGPIASPKPSYPGVAPHPTPGNGDHTKN